MFETSNNKLVDTFGRVATDLRVSVTDRCDLRCTYCMPEEGLQWTAPDDLLTFDEIERVVRIGTAFGIKSVRLTGGEPLMRRDVTELVARLNSLGLDDLSMTTNGTILDRHAADLKYAGLRRVDISLDSLDRHVFTAMTRRDKIDRVLSGISIAASVGLQPVKVNCVLVKGVNDNEILAFAELARTTGCHVRFIEYMPLDASEAWKPEDVVASADIVAQINTVHPIVADEDRRGPAAVYRFTDGTNGSVGVIGSVTEPFCDACDRLRLTADGQLRSCLFAKSETDIRALLRNGVSDEDIADAMATNVAAKQVSHGIGSAVFLRPRRSMSRIGG